MEGGEGDPIATEPSSRPLPNFLSQNTPITEDIKQPPKFLNCPPGMELILATEAIVVQQEVEKLEVFTGYETNNRYRILDSFGVPMYYAVEQTGGCARNCLRSSRPFKFIVLDKSASIVLQIERNCKCCCCFCCGKCCNEVNVSTEQGNHLGKISQGGGLFSCFCPSFTITDADNKERLKIKGPCSLCFCCKVKFDIQTTDGKRIGELTKEWGGFGREMLTKADNFGVTFPRDLEPIDKTLLMASVMLMDMMFFEGR